MENKDLSQAGSDGGFIVSEVKRVFLPGFTELPGCGERCWSSAIDVDQWGARIQAYGMTSAEASGLRDEILTALIGFNTAQSELSALREELAQVKKTSIVEIMALNGVIRRQSEEMTAAEQRNAELVDLLELINRERCFLTNDEWFRVRAAIKPTESGASE